ncbi:MAG: glycoside hydrolase family 172 protein [Spirochaetia bacterium]
MYHQPDLSTISKLTNAKTRLVTAENVYGEKGKGGMADISGAPQEAVTRIGQETLDPKPARDLGKGWKVRPCIPIPSGRRITILDAQGPGVIQHIWITLNNKYYRDIILRIYWDGEEEPSVEAPVGDFFCNGFLKQVNINALPINVNPTGGFNSYFPMPFGKRAVMTIENRNPEQLEHFFYAVTYAETEIDPQDGRFHAQFRRTNPLPYKEDYVIADSIRGKGHYAGTYMAWQQNSTGWWGEGEIKFFLDGDKEFPSLCGTGTEDYFGGAWGFRDNFSAPYLGYPTGECGGKPGSRHGLYRFHIMDPIRFEEELKVTMQALGWRSEQRFLPLQDDISSVAYWYQREPHNRFPELPGRDYLEVI